MITDLQIPADATWIGAWEGFHRIFDGKGWAIEHDITVTVYGTQHRDGRIKRKIAVGCSADPITSEQARKLATALIAAADAADEPEGDLSATPSLPSVGATCGTGRLSTPS